MPKKKKEILSLFKLAIDIKRNQECLLSLLDMLEKDVDPEYKEYIIRDMRRKLKK